MVFYSRFRFLAVVGCMFAMAVLSLRAQNYSVGPFTSPRSAAGLRVSSAFAVDATGNLFFADAHNQIIGKISPIGGVSIVAGGVGLTGSTDGAAGAARFYNPAGVAVDAAGNLYVGDSLNNVVRKITPDGVVSTLAGQANNSGAVDGTGSAARFYSPGAMAMDAAGNILVSDSGTNAIRKVTPTGVVTTVVRQDATNAAGATPPPFYAGAIAVDRNGNLFIADSIGRTVRKLAPNGVVSIVAGALGQIGSADGIGANARFNAPVGIAIEPNGNLVVSDNGNYSLRRVTPDGTVVTIAGQPDAVDRTMADGIGGAARFSGLFGLGNDAVGTLFIMDEVGDVVRKGTPVTAPSPPILVEGPAANGLSLRNVGERATVTFKTAATGATPISYQWAKNGAAIPGATASTFTIPSATTADEGSYTVTLSNLAGAFTSSPVTVKVYTPAFEAFTSRRTVAGGSFLWGIASGGGQLVTVGTNGKILTSGEGASWTARDSGTTEWLVGVTYGAGKFVAVGDHGIILVSTDGLAWTRAASSGTTQRLNNVAFGAGRFVAVGEGGAIVTSTDAQTWTAQNSGVSTWLRGLVYVPFVPLPQYIYGDNGTGRFYASGQNSVILESFDTGWRPSNYSSGTPVSGPDIEALAGGPIGIGQDGTISVESSYILYAKTPATAPDGTLHLQGGLQYVWQQADLGLTARFRGLALGAGAIFATGENGAIAASQSTSGPWSFIPSGTTANLVSGAFHGNSLFIVGENETILQSQQLATSRLINIATRGTVNGGANMLISGFVVSGDTPKTILLRAAGPALAAFNLDAGHLLSAPVLTLFDGANHPLASNRGWGTNANAAVIADTATRVGAFPFPANSADSALLATLPPGNYTAQIAGGGGASGVALVEAYDADATPTQGSRLINISTLGLMDGNPLIAGFVINGAAARRVLIRAVGPSLAQFGVTGLLTEPQIALYDHFGSVLQRMGAWSTSPTADDVRAAGTIAGAFALQEESKDAALVMSLLPGSYTVVVSGLNGGTGVALVEVYDLP